MPTIHEVNQILTVETPFGEAQVLFIMDYGIHRNTIWICSTFSDGKIRHFDTNQITLTSNHTLGFNLRGE